MMVDERLVLFSVLLIILIIRGVLNIRENAKETAGHSKGLDLDNLSYYFKKSVNIIFKAKRLLIILPFVSFLLGHLSIMIQQFVVQLNLNRADIFQSLFGNTRGTTGFVINNIKHYLSLLILIPVNLSFLNYGKLINHISLHFFAIISLVLYVFINT